MIAAQPDSLSALLRRRLRQRIVADGGWWPFDRYMAAALYEPGLGYYARDSRQFGLLPGSGSDFVTAPELSPLFGATLARPVAQALHATGTAAVLEFGGGSGALAEQLLAALPGDTVYAIVELSAALRERQRQRLAAFAPRVRWLDALPEAFDGVVVANEVLDALPVQLLRRAGGRWWERGVVPSAGGDDAEPGFAWADRPTALRPPQAATPADDWPDGAVLEHPAQARAWVATLAGVLRRGAVFLLDYGFPEHEYYHPQRHAGTLACHRGHRVAFDADAPLREPGDWDITAHVDFSAVALVAQDAGLEVAGYTSQAGFLLDAGLPALLAHADLRARSAAQKLLDEHEMGELFKVLMLARGLPGGVVPLGFRRGDRSHTL